MMEQVTVAGQAVARKRQRKYNGTAIIPVAGAMVALGTLQAATPGALVEQASAMATALAQVIETQKLYNTIQGKRHVRVEGWTTLGTMLGVLPREVSVTEEWGVGANEGRFCAYLKVRGLGQLESSRFDPACQALRRKLGKVAP
jgi:hypothetical protein